MTNRWLDYSFARVTPGEETPPAPTYYGADEEEPPDYNPPPTFGADLPVLRAQFVRALYRLAQRPAAWDPSITPPDTVLF